MFHHVDHAAEVGARVQQQHARLERVGMGALLDDGRPFAVVFAHHHQHAALDARRRQVAERVSSHIGAHNGFPGHRAAQGVMDGRPQHGRRRGFVGTGFHMHAQLVHVGLGLHHHIE